VDLVLRSAMDDCCLHGEHHERSKGSFLEPDHIPRSKYEIGGGLQNQKTHRGPPRGSSSAFSRPPLRARRRDEIAAQR
jgi:hypothetical protein